MDIVSKTIGYKNYRLSNLIISLFLAANATQSGAAFVYYRGSDSHFYHNYSLAPPEGTMNGSMGFAVAVSNEFAITGSFADRDLKGTIYVAQIPFVGSAPTHSPSGVQEKRSFGDIINNKRSFTFALILLLMLGALMIIVAAIISYYCCCCCMTNPAPLLKKKKKEEEESPYVVHSYPDYYYDHPEEYPYAQPPLPYPMPPPMYGPPPQAEDIKKDMKKDVDKASEGFVRQMFPYKVYGPRGYTEGQDAADFQSQIDDKIAQEDALRAGSAQQGGAPGAALIAEDDQSSSYVEQAKNRYAQFLNARNNSGGATEMQDAGMMGDDAQQMRMREDARIRAEEKARERYANFRKSAEEQARQKEEEEREMKAKLSKH